MISGMAAAEAAAAALPLPAPECAPASAVSAVTRNPTSEADLPLAVPAPGADGDAIVAAAPPQTMMPGLSSAAVVLTSSAPMTPTTMASVLPSATTLASPPYSVPDLSTAAKAAAPSIVMAQSVLPSPPGMAAPSTDARAISLAAPSPPAFGEWAFSGVAVSPATAPPPPKTQSGPPAVAAAAAAPPVLPTMASASLSAITSSEPDTTQVDVAPLPAVADPSIQEVAMAAAASVLASRAVAIPAGSAAQVTPPAGALTRVATNVVGHDDNRPSQSPSAPQGGHSSAAPNGSSGLASPPVTAAGSPVSRLTAGERVVSFIVRAVFYVSPSSLGANKVATPALMVAYFACRMAFLAGTADGEDVVYDTMTAMFKSPLDGWKCLCGMFGLCDRGLFLSGRLKRHAQFVGQPSSVPASLNDVVNPQGKPQWLSRRISLRKSLYLYPTSDPDTPGTLTAGELSQLRTHLDSPRCRSMCAFMGCKIMPGIDPDGNVARIAAIEFDWAHAWVPSSTPARLVDSLKSVLLKPPNADLSRVAAYPRSQAAAVLRNPSRAAPESPAGKSVARPSTSLAVPPSSGVQSATRAAPALSTASAVAALAVSVDYQADEVDVGPVTSGRRPTESPSADVQTTGKRGTAWPSKPPRAKRGAPRLKPSEPRHPVLAAPPPLMTGDELVGCIGPSVVWPDGAWAIQVPLPPDLDALAVGRPQLDIQLESKSLSPDSQGEYHYALVVTQEGNIVNDLSRELGAFVSAAPGLDDTSRSLDFLRGIRRIAEIRRWESPSALARSLDARLSGDGKRQEAPSAARKSVDRALQSQDRDSLSQDRLDYAADGETDGGSDAIDEDNGDGDNGGGPVATVGNGVASKVPVAFDDVHLTVTHATRVRAAPFAYRFSFASRLRLNSATTICLRDAGRLVVVVGAERDRPHFRVKA